MSERLKQAYPNTLLRDQRKQREWTQAHVAEALSVTELTVRRWEQGKSRPSSYYVQKLCTLFETGPQTLGLVPASKPTSTLTENLSDVEPVPAGEHVVEALNPNTLPVTPAESRKVFQAQVRIPNLRRWQTYIFVVLVVVICLASAIYANKQLSPSQPADTVHPLHLLYEGDWSQNLAGWKVSYAWHWSSKDNGMLATDTTTNSLAIAPYTPPTPNYAIEARIQRIGYSNLGGNAFGLVLRLTTKGGYVSGLGAHELPEHFFIGQLAFSGTDKKPYVPADLARSSSAVNDGWHTYRLEVDKGHLSFSFDGKLMSEADDYTQIDAGQVGIYAIGALIHIESFKVYAL